MEKQKVKPNTPQWQKDLVALLQRNEYGIYVDVKTGDVFESNELSPDTYLGNLPRKRIPNRKKLEREYRERRERLEKKSLETFHCQNDKEVRVREVSIGGLIRNGLPTNAVGPYLFQLQNQGYIVREVD